MTASAKLAALDAATTPGRWEYYLVASTDGGPGEVLIGPDPDGPLWSREASYQAEDDARHIVALRNALPELMALVAAAENLTLDNDDGPYLGESLEQWEHRIVGTREKQRHNLSAALADLNAKL